MKPSHKTRNIIIGAVVAIFAFGTCIGVLGSSPSSSSQSPTKSSPVAVASPVASPVAKFDVKAYLISSLNADIPTSEKNLYVQPLDIAISDHVLVVNTVLVPGTPGDYGMMQADQICNFVALEAKSDDNGKSLGIVAVILIAYGSKVASCSVPS